MRFKRNALNRSKEFTSLANLREILGKLIKFSLYKITVSERRGYYKMAALQKGALAKRHPSKGHPTKRLSVTILDCLELSQTILNYLRLFRTISDYLGLSRIITDYLRLSPTIWYNPELSGTIWDCLGLGCK